MKIQQTKPRSKTDGKKLRKAKASELKPGGVWYYKTSKGEYETVISDLDYLDSDYRRFCAEASKFGYMYLRKDKPHYSLTGCQTSDKARLDYYKK